MTTPVSPAPAAPPPAARKPLTWKKSCLGCLGVFGVLVLLSVACGGVSYFFDQSAYNSAHAAREEARCDEAITGYDKVINGFGLFEDLVEKSTNEKAECVQFQESAGAQSAGQLSDALFSYQSLVETYPDSPLVTPAVGQMNSILSDNPGSDLASDEFCIGFEPLATIAGLASDSPAWPGFFAACGDYYQQSGDEVSAFDQYTRVLNDYAAAPEAESASQALLDSTYACDQSDMVLGMSALDQGDYLPNFLNGCGQRYEDNGQYNDAARVYQAFLDTYPGHSLESQVKEAYARAAIAYARDLGAGEIPAPQQVGGETGATTVVVIQNDSPNSLRIVMTGPETRIEEIEPCVDCETYTGNGPEFCPEQGPMGTYELPSGTYEVMVESSTEDDVTPFTGTWDLTGGEYYSCFLIIRGE